MPPHKKLIDITSSFIPVRTRFGNRKLENPLGFSSFGFETANDAEVETMEEEVRSVSLQEVPVKREDHQPLGATGSSNGGGAIKKFKKKEKKKNKKKEF